MMSIPTRFNVITNDKTYKNQSMFTLSYGTDTSDREIWKNRFQEYFNYLSKEKKEKRCPWIFDKFIIEIVHHEDIIFTEKDFTL